MTAKHDYKAALEFLQVLRDVAQIDDYACEEPTDVVGAIEHALKIADKLMQEPSDEVMYLINKSFNLHPNDNRSTLFAFKAMCGWLLKEVE